MSASPSRLRRTVRELRPRGGAWLLIAGACAVGALLFLALWLGRRDAPSTTAGDMTPPGAADRALAPLPAPLPAGATTASGVEFSEPPPPAPPAPAPSIAAPPGVDTPAAATPAPGDAAQQARTAPRPRSTPGPTYPRASLRRGETGEVLLRIHVGSNGRTEAVDVVRSSGFERLDRAAVSAVRRWRFEPAMRDGQPVRGEVQVPVDFTAAGR